MSNVNNAISLSRLCWKIYNYARISFDEQKKDKKKKKKDEKKKREKKRGKEEFIIPPETRLKINGWTRVDNEIKVTSPNLREKGPRCETAF